MPAEPGLLLFGQTNDGDFNRDFRRLTGGRVRTLNRLGTFFGRRWSYGKIIALEKIMLVDWRAPAQSIRTQRQVYCFEDRGFARIIVADEYGMVRQDQLRRTDAPEIIDRYGVDLQRSPLAQFSSIVFTDSQLPPIQSDVTRHSGKSTAKMDEWGF